MSKSCHVVEHGILLAYAYFYGLGAGVTKRNKLLNIYVQLFLNYYFSHFMHVFFVNVIYNKRKTILFQCKNNVTEVRIFNQQLCLNPRVIPFGVFDFSHF